MAKSKFSNEDLTRWKREINPAPIITKRVKLHREGSEFLGCCPDIYHKERLGHSDAHPSLTVWKLPDGTWGFKCFSCDAKGNVFQFVQDFDKIPFAAAVARVLEEAGVEGWENGTEQPAPSLPAEEPKNHVTFPFTQYTQSIQALERAPEAQEWLRKRGITMETARKFSLGFVQNTEKIAANNTWRDGGWVLFPTLSADGQTVTAVKYRSLIGKKVKKSEGKQTSGILRAPNTSTTLFNFQNINLAEDVWIVEGEPDTLVLVQAGLRAVGYPMSGYNPSEEECEALSSVPRRFLAGDSDKVGAKAMADLKSRLRGATFEIKWPNNRRDANDVLTNECGNNAEKFKILVEDLKARATQTETEPIFRNGDDIQPCRINWLWDSRIPLGKITLFAGNPDNGKSLASTSVASYVTKGKIFPESITQNPPADVLMLIGEDDLEDTAVPRLMAAEADMKRIHFLVAARPVKQEDREVRLDMDIPAIEKKLESTPNIRLIIIDPISNYLGEVSMIAEQEVRSILIPLKRAAEKYNVAVVIVMHLNKKSDLDAISRVGGAMAFIGVARCSWLFARNVQEEEEQKEGELPTEKLPDTFSMLRIKNNLVSANRAGLSYSVAVKPIPVANEPDIITPYIIWGNVIEGSADDALGGGRRQQPSEPVIHRAANRPDDALQEAIRWLENALQDNLPKVSKVLIAEAKAGPGIAEKTLRRAKAALKVRDFKDGAPAKFYWVMDPLNETMDADGVVPEQSSFIQVEGE